MTLSSLPSVHTPVHLLTTNNEHRIPNSAYQLSDAEKLPYFTARWWEKPFALGGWWIWLADAG